MSENEKDSSKVAASQAEEVKLDTPQQDRTWSDSEKLKWILASSARLLKAFNAR